MEPPARQAAVMPIDPHKPPCASRATSVTNLRIKVRVRVRVRVRSEMRDQPCSGDRSNRVGLGVD